MSNDFRGANELKCIRCKYCDYTYGANVSRYQFSLYKWQSRN